MADVSGNTIDLAQAYAAVSTRFGPAYQRIKQLILTEIERGSWRPGDQLPSEHQLVAALGISRMTINRAYRELADEGAVTRTAGVGSFVAQPRPATALLAVTNIAADIVREGHQHRMQVMFNRRESAVGSPITGPAGQVFHSLIVHFDNDVAVQVEDRYVNPVAAPHYSRQTFAVRTPNEYLVEVAPLTRAHHVVEAALPAADEATLLSIKRSEPCLVISRTTWSGELVVSSARLVFPGSRQRLEGTFEA